MLSSVMAIGEACVVNGDSPISNVRFAILKPW